MPSFWKKIKAQSRSRHSFASFLEFHNQFTVINPNFRWQFPISSINYSCILIINHLESLCRWLAQHHKFDFALGCWPAFTLWHTVGNASTSLAKHMGVPHSAFGNVSNDQWRLAMAPTCCWTCDAMLRVFREWHLWKLGAALTHFTNAAIKQVSSESYVEFHTLQSTAQWYTDVLSGKLRSGRLW